MEARTGKAPLGFVLLLEDIGAVLDARTIAAAPRVIGLSVGGEDLTLSLGARPTPDVLKTPKLLVHYAAKARGFFSFGMLRSVADYSDLVGIAAAAREANEHGFDGATCVHPSAVALLNAAFTPSAGNWPGANACWLQPYQGGAPSRSMAEWWMRPPSRGPAPSWQRLTLCQKRNCAMNAISDVTIAVTTALMLT